VEHRYRELPPPPELAATLLRLWIETTSDRPDAPPLRVVPDGCIDVVWVAGAPAVVAGPATGPAFPALPPGATLVGARFRPGMASSVLGVPADELADLEVPLVELWGRLAAPHLDRFEESGSARDGIVALQALVADRLRQVGPGDDLVANAARWLARHPTARVDRLPSTVGLGDRQLRRRFEAAVGYGPKTYQRVMRFQRWLRLASVDPRERPALTDLAASAGYADQAHLTREVTRLAGLSPTALLAAMAADPA
jgi:AraC-like DNA-binding protein